MIFLKTSPVGFATLAVLAAGMMAIFCMRTRAEDKDFKPIVEAEMPEGFPSYTPVGEVQMKQYPEYRKAVALESRSRSFFTLFSHIKRNKIAMTAPVELSYENREKPSEESMAFLYGSMDMGETGREGYVEVVDVPAMISISTGVRGPRRAEAVAEARDRLDDWLEANKDRYVADGELRVMAYNSPFVPRSRNYFEVEIPIRAVEDAE